MGTLGTKQFVPSAENIRHQLTGAVQLKEYLKPNLLMKSTRSKERKAPILRYDQDTLQIYTQELFMAY